MCSCLSLYCRCNYHKYKFWFPFSIADCFNARTSCKAWSSHCTVCYDTQFILFDRLELWISPFYGLTLMHNTKNCLYIFSISHENTKFCWRKRAMMAYSVEGAVGPTSNWSFNFTHQTRFSLLYLKLNETELFFPISS